MNNLILTKNFKKKVIIHMNNQILNFLKSFLIHMNNG